MDAINTYKALLDNKLNIFPRGYWVEDNYEKAKEITRYLIEDILKWSDDDIREKLNQKIFVKYRLGGMLYIVFKNSPYSAINNAYPNRFKPWEFKKVPINTWNKETAIKALKWVVKEKLKLSDEELLELYSEEFLRNNGLRAAINLFDSEYEYINNVYSGRFKPWEFKQCPKSYWNEDTKKDAIRWLVIEKLGIDVNDEIILTTEDFDKNGLKSLLLHHFNGSWRQAVGSMYK